MSASANGSPAKPDWQPALYKRFAGERERPALDLIQRVPLDRPDFILDVGCGAGNVTALLRERWPQSRLLGMDNSPAMLTAARRLLPEVAFVEGDAARWTPPEPPDLLFTNAVLQWLPHHETLFPRLFGLVRPGGVMAVQMPRNHGRPSHTLMIETAKSGPWRAKLATQIDRPAPVAEPAFYARLMAPLADNVEIWETDYLMRLAGDNPVVTWTRATGLRPFMEPLDEDEKTRFEADYAERIRKAYPPEADGSTLFAFKRIFILAVRPA
ncbi:MAG TPA: trans-aconitate 2-methyltransferase [Hypericibacter adhaerens]|jgi:trans-aconitate 2-methyltransferase|uniref:Trans-aconitate 2-methyltransferase n=1 Tax=Hypericibacter adhaerens TaxID=2602016 RepID=A0A5J6N570_9PROT|nr:trans-aconitate 2-methyltransferase [Hypericibacter adhaerens]QEX22066.1 trans-aconitate 2-methyltransferase [Hypericibacter adhaerens]HWA46276.1 trans-aconitate 2-methyltransferase [Hypericibacter adhaerens]